MLTVVYDETCELCRRCRAWLERQPQLVPLGFVPASDPEVAAQLGTWLPVGEELVVVGDDGRVWVGPDAFITCLWALVSYRSLAGRLQLPGFRSMAQQVFHGLSAGRGVISAVMGPPVGGEGCVDGSCSTGVR